ncbi:hypothetical protein EJ02DRAFT_459395 [Clathrospora elynae]|uniref:Uncharacterized protein n=1 Tax=Clathrospora elynae TaxID=706981 RepID=A0A6A5S996_9PLEO|nr:hypothetical protein EJ02DRAFT_459395 [Clathrospora elynae]
MANAFINVATLIATILPLAFLEKPHDPAKQVQISLGVGDDANAGGSMPHVAVWDGNGIRVSQYKGDANGHIDEKSTIGLTLDNNQNGGKPADPEYISIVMQENDAICLALVVATSNGKQWTWTGDIGYTCGAQWYNSKYTFGGSNQPIRCVWLDKDHTNGIIAQGMSLHIRDFSGESGLLRQYNEDQGRLCENTARMTFHSDIRPDDIVRFFDPPLEYMREESADPMNSTAGALVNPDQGKDRTTRAYADGTNLDVRKLRKRQSRDLHGRRKMKARGVKNLDPGHLTVSHMKGHSAKELCDDDMSLGADFVSMDEGLFCDMERAQLWPLCNAALTEDCFDLERQEVRSNGKKRDAPPKKTYTVTNEWK